MAAKQDINELRSYFNGLKISKKKEFILKLKEKTKGSEKYKSFLAECVDIYNQEVKDSKQAKAANETLPEISSEAFNIAMAAIVGALQTSPDAAKQKLLGTWQREFEGKIFYYTFNDDGSFETNDVSGQDILTGHYIIDQDNVLHMEPHELLQIANLTFSVSGLSMNIQLLNNVSLEYKRCT